MADFDYIVIGGGHNGLVCGAYLAQAGQRVAVLEQYSVLGGYNTTEELPEAPGYRLNVGAIEHITLFETPILEDLDLECYGVDYIFRDEMYLFPFLDGTDLPFYQSVDRTIEAMAEVSPRDAGVYADFTEFSRAILGLLGAVSFGPPPRFGELAAMMNAQTGIEANQLLWVLLTSPWAVLDAWFEHPKIKAALGYWAAHTQTAPSQPGGGYAPCIMAGSHGTGVGRPKGGSGALIEGLAAVVTDNGGDVRTNAEVEQIVVENGRAVGVRLVGGERVTAHGGVVSSIDARRVFLNLVGEEHTSYDLRRKLGNVRSGRTNISEFKIDAALSGPLDWSAFPHGNEFRVGMHLLCPSLEYLDAAFADIHRGVEPEGPAMMVGTASALDPSLAPVGGETLWVSCFAPFHRRDGRSWDDTKEAFADAVLDGLSHYAPNVREVIEARLVTSPLDWHRRTGSLRANPNHLDMTLDQFFAYRPLPELADYRTPVAGLYLTGSGTHPGGGVSGNPGYNTAQAVMQDLGLVPPPKRGGPLRRLRRLSELLPAYRKLRKYL